MASEREEAVRWKCEMCGVVAAPCPVDGPFCMAKPVAVSPAPRFTEEEMAGIVALEAENARMLEVTPEMVRAALSSYLNDRVGIGEAEGTMRERIVRAMLVAALDAARQEARDGE